MLDVLACVAEEEALACFLALYDALEFGAAVGDEDAATDGKRADVEVGS